jgi:hypothetical protein
VKGAESEEEKKGGELSEELTQEIGKAGGK